MLFRSNELVESFGSEKESTGAHAFSQAVQKAIDQGVPYPDLEQWPVVLENHQVLESLQQVWRRMSEGDIKGMTLAAQRVQGQINSQTYLPARTWDNFSRAWPLILIFAVSLAVIVAWVRARSLRRLITILHLYRASRHESGKILGHNVMDLHERARTGELTHESLMEWLLTLVHIYTDPDNGLVAYMVSLGDDLVGQIQGVKASANLNDVVMRGFEGAQLFYKAWRLMSSPTVTLVPKDLASWRVVRYPALATVILQEWFFNCIRESDWGSGSVISVEVQGGAAVIESSGDLTASQVATLMGPPSSGLLQANASGLVLIRDICRYAFGSRVEVGVTEHKIRLSIPLRIRKDRKKQ